jgi:hypothetical protein
MNVKGGAIADVVAERLARQRNDCISFRVVGCGKSCNACHEAENSHSQDNLVNLTSG